LNKFLNSATDFFVGEISKALIGRRDARPADKINFQSTTHKQARSVWQPAAWGKVFHLFCIESTTPPQTAGENPTTNKSALP
jgi:hypothetical protein